MTTDPFVDLLQEMDPRRLRSLREQWVTARTRFDQAVQAVDAVLLDRGGAPVAAPRSNGASRSARAGSRRELIKRLMEAHPHDRVWVASEVTRALQAEGTETTRESVRVAMRRMVETGELERPEGGQGFKLASPNGSHDELSPKAVASADGDDREMRLESGSQLGAG